MNFQHDCLYMECNFNRIVTQSSELFMHDEHVDIFEMDMLSIYWLFELNGIPETEKSSPNWTGQCDISYVFNLHSKTRANWSNKRIDIWK